MDDKTIEVKLISEKETVFEAPCLNATFVAGEGVISLQASQGEFLSRLKEGRVEIRIDKNTLKTFRNQDGMAFYKDNKLVLVSWRFEAQE